MSAITDNRNADPATQAARKVTLQGRLQGIGVRPAIYRLATELGLAGQVRNTTQGVEIQVEGPREKIETFRNSLRSKLPEGAQVLREDWSDTPWAKVSQFEIVQDASAGAVVTSVPLDVAVCGECLTEVHRPGDRRFQYPFNSCAGCGPRYTVIREMPFEREDTAMVDFPLCGECLAEYHDVENRRFHAQTISCPRCGPRLWGVTSDGLEYHDQDKALDLAAGALVRGQIVALKGLGGYQLLVDATNPQAVERLRQKKGRLSKPLAVMTRTALDAERLADTTAEDRQALTSAANPIVLLKAKGHSGLAGCVSPGLKTVGILLPTTPLHDLLLARVRRPLVCTSGNREGEPLAFEVEPAETDLADLCDFWLHHNRPIVRPIDDSVVRVIQGKEVTLRLARGMAPLRLELEAGDHVIAMGGQMKSAAAWTSGGSGFLGPHIGELDNLAAQERYRWHLADWQSLYRLPASRPVCDRHPDYFTSQLAAEQSAEALSVQHHHAHVAAAMLEHRLLDQTTLGVSWDGTGYGADHTVWGGEFLIVAGKRCERFAHFRPFTLPGGEAAIREPWRVAVSILDQADCLDACLTEKPFAGRGASIEMIRKIAHNPQFSPVTTSAGRLLDAIASVVLGREQCEYEGQLPMMLEGIADQDEQGAYPLALCEAEVLQLDWRPLVRQVAEDLWSGISPGSIAMRVHRGLAGAVVAVCRRRPELPVVLTGGVFQNRLLCELTAEMALQENLGVYLPGVIPPGDGGLAAGQLVWGQSVLDQDE